MFWLCSSCQCPDRMERGEIGGSHLTCCSSCPWLCSCGRLPSNWCSHRGSKHLLDHFCDRTNTCDEGPCSCLSLASRKAGSCPGWGPIDDICCQDTDHRNTPNHHQISLCVRKIGGGQYTISNAVGMARPKHLTTRGQRMVGRLRFVTSNVARGV